MPPKSKKRAREPAQAPLLTPKGIETLLRPPATRGAAPTSVVLQTISIRRFALDESVFHATGETTRPDCGDAFDVTLSDGEQKLKCALSLELNPYVYKGWLSGVGQLVRVEGWKYLLRDDAASLGERTPPVVLLTKLAHDLGEERPPRKMMVLNADGLGHPKAVEPPFGRPEWAHTSEATPLVGVRQHYLRLDSDAVELGAPWEPREADTLREEYIAADGAVTGSADDGDGAIETLLGRAQPLADVLRWHERKPTNAEKRGAGRPSTKEEPPAIVGRVIAKSALLHFGGLHERRAQPHATQFTLLLADASTARTPLSVTVWNGRCEEWYSSVGVGDALLLRGYRLNWQLRNAADPTAGGKYEVSLNTSHPTSRLLPLTDAEVDGGGGDGDGLPDALTLRPLRATDRGALAQLAARRAAAGESADEETVDVVGAVLKALPPFRLRHRAAADKSVRFRRARWVVVLARGEAQPFPILLLEQHCEPRSLFEAPRLLELLLFRHLEVLPAAAAAAAGGSGGGRRAAADAPIVLASTRWLQLVPQRAFGPWARDGVVHSAITWWHTERKHHKGGSELSARRSPAPLAPLGLLSDGAAPLAPLRTALVDRRHEFVSKLAEVAGSLHARELVQLWVSATLEVDDAGGPSAGEGVAVRACDLNRADVKVRACVAVGGAADGTALWRSLFRCTLASATSRARPPAHSAAAQRKLFEQLRGVPLVLAIDLYRGSSAMSGVVHEVVGAWRR